MTISIKGSALDDEHYGILEEFIHNKDLDRLRASLFDKFSENELNEMLVITKKPTSDQLQPLRENTRLRNKKDIHNNTLFHAAALRANKYLLHSYLSPRSTLIPCRDENKFGLTPDGMAILSGNLENFKSVSLCYRDSGLGLKTKILPTIIGPLSIDVNGLFLFQTAVYFGVKNIVEDFLAEEQDFFTQSIYGIGSALHLALLAHQREIYELLKKDKKYLYKLEQKGYQNLTPEELKYKIDNNEFIHQPTKRATASESHVDESGSMINSEEPWDGDEEFEELLRTQLDRHS